MATDVDADLDVVLQDARRRNAVAGHDEALALGEVIELDILQGLPRREHVPIELLRFRHVVDIGPVDCQHPLQSVRRIYRNLIDAQNRIRIYREDMPTCPSGATAK